MERFRLSLRGRSGTAGDYGEPSSVIQWWNTSYTMWRGKRKKLTWLIPLIMGSRSLYVHASYRSRCINRVQKIQHSGRPCRLSLQRTRHAKKMYRYQCSNRLLQQNLYISTLAMAWPYAGGCLIVPYRTKHCLIVPYCWEAVWQLRSYVQVKLIE